MGTWALLSSGELSRRTQGETGKGRKSMMTEQEWIPGATIPRGTKAWVWEVRPKDRTAPIVATGIRDNEDQAKADVVEAMKAQPSTADHGYLSGPKGVVERCIRARNDELTWIKEMPAALSAPKGPAAA